MGLSIQKDNKLQDVFMGCYGIGVSRIVAAAIEQNYDEDGIIFPESISPFKCYLILINQKNNTDLNQKADYLYQKLKSNNIDVFFDDRDQNPGVKFRDANLMGVPYQVVLGEKTLSDGTVELISRKDQKKEILDFTKIIKKFKV